MTLLRAFCVGPFVGLFSLLAAAPYFILAGWGIAAHPWIEISSELDRSIGGILEALPSRRSNDLDAREFGQGKSIIMLEAVVISFIYWLALYRIQIGALQVLGVSAIHRLRTLFFPPRSWRALPTTFLFLFAVIVAGFAMPPLVEDPQQVDPIIRQLDQTALSNSFRNYFRQNFGFLLYATAAVAVVFVPFGHSMIQRSTGARLPTSTAFRSSPALLVLCGTNACLAILATISVLQFGELILPADTVAILQKRSSALAMTIALLFAFQTGSTAILHKDFLMRLAKT